MSEKYPVVTLCGSTKFKNDFIRLEKELTLEGNIVLTCGLFNHADKLEISETTKMMLDDMHKRKIDMSDYIMVINPRDYIGESTKSEIEYADRLNKPIRYAYPHAEKGVNGAQEFKAHCAKLSVVYVHLQRRTCVGNKQLSVSADVITLPKRVF